MKDTYQNEFQKEKKMLSLLFTICIIWFVGKFFVFGLRASWGIIDVYKRQKVTGEEPGLELKKSSYSPRDIPW